MSVASHIADVCFIIPNWNGEGDLHECLDSVREQTVWPRQTIVIEKGAKEGSQKVSAAEYSWVTAITLPGHPKFSTAVNEGVRATNCAYLAVIHGDTQLDPDWLATLLDVLHEHPELGAAQGKMLNFYRRNIIDVAGDGLNRSGISWMRGSGEPDDGRYNRKEYVFGACVGATLYRRIVFDKVGFFDPDFVSSCEEQDFAFRAQLTGFRTMYVPDALCYHKHVVPGDSDARHYARLQERDLTLFYVKNFPWQLLLLKSPVIFGSGLVRLLRAMLKGAGGAVVNGFVEGLLLLPTWLPKRREVQNTRTVGVRYISSLMRAMAQS
jgi:GT2 family glycosyltransferase